VIKTSFADDVKQDDSKRRYLNLWKTPYHWSCRLSVCVYTNGRQFWTPSKSI